MILTPRQLRRIADEAENYTVPDVKIDKADVWHTSVEMVIKTSARTTCMEIDNQGLITKAQVYEV